MGLERNFTVFLQHVHSNYEIDLFQNLMKAVKEAVEAAGAENVDPNSPSLKVIADHIRACSFIIADLEFFQAMKAEAMFCVVLHAAVCVTVLSSVPAVFSSILW